MTKFTLELVKSEQRPIIRLDNRTELSAMLDTGALFPVWVASENQLRNFGGRLVARDKSFGGFGGMTKGNVYRLPLFQVGELIFPNFPILAAPHRLPCQMLLSATVFSNLVYEIDDKQHQLSVTIPDDEPVIRNLIIRDENGRLHMLLHE